MDVDAAVERVGPGAKNAMDEMLCRLLGSFGAHSRNCLRAFVVPASTPASR